MTQPHFPGFPNCKIVSWLYIYISIFTHFLTSPPAVLSTTFFVKLFKVP